MKVEDNRGLQEPLEDQEGRLGPCLVEVACCLVPLERVASCQEAFHLDGAGPPLDLRVPLGLLVP